MTRSKNDIRNFVNIPDYISLGNALSGILSIFASYYGRFELAAGLIILGAIFDLFDGRVARKMNLSSEFGVQLDSLCDLISFVTAPAFFAFMVTKDQIEWNFIILALYVLAGILRLARFNVTGTTDGGKYFEGVPVPVSLVLPPLFFLFEYLGINSVIWLMFYVIHGILMISVVKIKKL